MAKSSFSRSIELLDLFTEESPLINIEQIEKVFGYRRSTAYRYLKNLADVGFVIGLGSGTYALGPRIIELERKIRVTDPLLASGRKVMPRIADEIPNSVLLLCNLWGDRVLCIHEEIARTSSGDRAVGFGRGRGIPYPLFRGAASRAILANLPSHRIRSIYLKHNSEIREAGLGEDWASFRRNLQKIRRAGYAETVNTLGTERAAVAVPVLDAELSLVACLSRVMPQEQYRGLESEMVIDGLRRCGAEIIVILREILKEHATTHPGREELVGSSGGILPRRLSHGYA